jgi:hypothetical protein
VKDIGKICFSAGEGINLKIKEPWDIYAYIKHKVGNLGYHILRKQVA